MPLIRTYETEVRDLAPRHSNEPLSKFYGRTLAEFAVGKYGEAELFIQEKIPVIIEDLTAACKHRGFGLKIISINRRTVFFKIIADPQCAFDF